MYRNRLMISSLFAFFTFTQVLNADVFWSDDFNTDSSADYDVLAFVEGRDQAEFVFDYSSVGIPEAPNSKNGKTTGVRFTANDPFEDTSARASGVQIAPIDLDVALEGIDYSVAFDVWMNVNGPLPGGGGGSTEAFMVGVGFSATRPIEAGINDGTYFTLTGEAGVSTDLRSFTDDGFNGVNEDDSPINVGPVDLNDDYYADIFPGGIDVELLPVQGGQDNQVGVTIQGQMAFAWHQVRVDVNGMEVSFFVDDLLIAQDLDAVVEGTVFVGLADYFSSVTDIPDWGFTIVDNLRVFSPVSGDFNESGELDAFDIDLLTREVQSGTNHPAFDLTGDSFVNDDDRRVWVNELRFTYFGDANLDGEFNSSDFVTVFQAGEYEDGIAANSGWATGDWNGDGEFDTGDFVLAFQEGGFEIGPRVAVASVPEPSGWIVMVLAGWLSLRWRRHQGSGKI